ncbi:hypothetical protein BZZ01_27640 [Nostocales cyanobacterium HT-58-2]|nr:hypothetical protein BZZ01_27640 [Nostocales cyanobacterium HT-58-2]
MVKESHLSYLTIARISGRHLKVLRIDESALKEGFQRQMLHFGKHARCYNAGNPRNALAPP